MRSILITSGTTILLIVILFLFREPMLLVIGDFLIVQDSLQPVDAIHVISGPDNTRIDYGIQLYQQGYAKQIFFTGGWCPCLETNIADYSRERALHQGVPPQAIAIDDAEVTSTYAEIGQLKEVIDHSPAPILTIIGVSDAFHMRRSRWTYRKVLGDQVNVQMAPVPFEMSDFQHRWWTDEASRQFVKSEYLKIVYYYARYKFSIGPIERWLASFDQD